MKPTIALSFLAALLSAGTAGAQLPAYHGNAQHTGYSTARGPVSPVLKWRLDLSGEVISSPVLGPDGTIYLGSVIKDTRHPEHFITAVNADGTVKWRFRTGWWDTQTQSSPALGADGRIYVGAQDGYLYALNPDGTLAWRFAAASPVQQHPVVGSDGTVYIGMDGRLYAFDPSGAVRWTVTLGSNMPGGPALAPDGQTIYAFGHISAEPAVATLYAFRLDGTIKWQYSGFYGYYPALSPPTVAADGTVIVLSGQVVAISPNGVEKWRYSPSASYYNSYASLAVNPAGDVVFAFDWYFGKLSADGIEQWQIEFRGGDFGNELEHTYSAPLIDADGNIFLGLGTGKRFTRPWGKVVRAYTPAGTLLWEFPVGEGVYTSSPALAPDGTLYVGSMDGALYALRDDTAPAPNAIASLSVSPQSVAGGKSAQGTVAVTQSRGSRRRHGPALGRSRGDHDPAVRLRPRRCHLRHVHDRHQRRLRSDAGDDMRHVRQRDPLRRVDGEAGPAAGAAAAAVAQRGGPAGRACAHQLTFGHFMRLTPSSPTVDDAQQGAGWPRIAIEEQGNEVRDRARRRDRAGRALRCARAGRRRPAGKRLGDALDDDTDGRRLVLRGADDRWRHRLSGLHADDRRRSLPRGAGHHAIPASCVWNLEIEACDESSTEEAVAQLWACTGSGPGSCSIVEEVRTGLAAAPGCARFRADVVPFMTVNNYNFTYVIDVFGTNGAANVPVRFRGVRIAMLRQVSEAPATATFSDVPTSHPYFRFIEALADALISAGCGNRQFCPDRPLTRGEAAVFISEALGLNFPD